jgi:hypothetical protein
VTISYLEPGQVSYHLHFFNFSEILEYSNKSLYFFLFHLPGSSVEEGNPLIEKCSVYFCYLKSAAFGFPLCMTMP